MVSKLLCRLTGKECPITFKEWIDGTTIEEKRKEMFGSQKHENGCSGSCET